MVNGIMNKYWKDVGGVHVKGWSVFGVTMAKNTCHGYKTIYRVLVLITFYN